MLNKKIDFKIKGVKGELSLKLIPFCLPKLYQNGVQIKSNGLMKQSYQVDTVSGKKEAVKIDRSRGFAFQAKFRDTTTPLEDPISVSEIIICILPIVFMLTYDGLMAGLVGALGSLLALSLIRFGESFSNKIFIVFVLILVTFFAYYYLIR